MKIDASSFRLIKPELIELLKNLETGDVLKGKVLEALGNSILIRAKSGEIFTAILQEGASIPKDAFVELVIKDIADGKIFAELKGEDKASDPDIKVSDLLKQLNLPVNEKNMEAAKLLLKYKLPLNRETIGNITGLQKSIDNLNNSTGEKMGLMLSGLNIKDTPVDVLNKIVLNWPDDFAAFEAILENDGQKPEANEAAIIKQTTAGSASDSKAAEIPGKAAVITITDSSEALKGAVITDSNETPREAAITGRGETPKEGVGYVSPLSDMAAAESNKGVELIRALAGLGIESESEIKMLAAKVESILSSIKNTDMEAITYLVSKEMEITPRNLGMLIKNIENRDVISQFLDKLQEKIIRDDNPKLKAISESIRKVFLEPRQLEDREEVARQLKDIASLGEKLESYLKTGGDKDPEIREALSNLKDCIDFIRNVNQHNNFLQIPLLINDNTTAAKLYVFKDGKREKRINPEDATVVVALDLMNLGHLESMIRVKGKTVDITFRTENKSIGSMIEKNILMLKEALGEKGYYLSPIRVINLEQPFSLLSLEAMINESGYEKIHFDMRV
ncbi:MAG TPA: flagellar hook-length control protein FliK [Bacillota bacterium]|nr:flagellar hook-length control protein FliK [Bacillota bacterium]HPX68093.1 flagellar hook-length control protein FliK [Bacillota bacterium]HQA64469.1 flagellar hook-length control protein FliK [Bacillota bacterium]HQO42620.1 flagellar hook-length control protein FliK [Bacillota bacterium]HQQ45262.1 flagellar hook-length control protein FliK [Bacillota bacterium]